MAEVIRMPRMSDTMTEGVIAVWHKNVGDLVKPGDLLAEVETDKATMELESYQSGTLLYRAVQAGQPVKVDGIIAIIGKEGEDYQHLLDEVARTRSEAQSQPQSELQSQQSVMSDPLSTTSVGRGNGSPSAAVETRFDINITPQTHSERIKASPLAKKLAAEKGINLLMLKGTGDEGRIIKRDIEAYLKSMPHQPAPPHTGRESYTDIPVSQMRKTIARRLSDSMFTAPHFYLTISVHMDYAGKVRASINAVSHTKVSFNDMVIKAVAIALKQHPQVNGSWLGDSIRTYHHVHIGVAVAVEEGLLVPVIRFANEKSLLQLAAETKELAEKAKTKKLQPADMQGNTFTVSNLGMFGIEEFTAIINPPDACILAVGAIQPTVVVSGDKIMQAQTMKITLSCDHRVVDGATGARFLHTVKSLLEDPVRLLL